MPESGRGEEDDHMLTVRLCGMEKQEEEEKQRGGNETKYCGKNCRGKEKEG